MTTALSVASVTKRYASVAALYNISFSVKSGRLFGIAGADGAGKSTLLNIIATLLFPDSGTVTCLGYSLTKEFRRIRTKIGYMPQRFSLYGDLSVGENLAFFADIFNVKTDERKTRTAELLAFSRLNPFINRTAAKLSGGMKQKLALCCALIHTPELLILDEPTTGVDPVSRREFWDIIMELRRRGCTLIIATPYMDELMRCDEILFMHQGTTLASGVPADMCAHLDGSVYELHGNDERTPLYCRRDMVLPLGIYSVYPSNGVVHIIADPMLSPADILERVRKELPMAASIIPGQPSMEDLFHTLLSIPLKTVGDE